MTVAYRSCIVFTDSATRRGSSRSKSTGLPVSIWQKSHRRVHWSPPIRKVASRSSQHSKMFGQPASWQTVCRPSDFTKSMIWVYSGPVFNLVLIHSGFRSIGVKEFRASIRSNLGPSDLPSGCSRYGVDTIASLVACEIMRCVAASTQEPHAKCGYTEN
ncbi:unannotated protein [freshwater metagenome]|uniref:Unannotated protein n=1 Tax=freshwater metagenome TaxID=449393 RepID=A0A6J7BS00_9ZZZZ